MQKGETKLKENEDEEQEFVFPFDLPSEMSNKEFAQNEAKSRPDIDPDCLSIFDLLLMIAILCLPALSTCCSNSHKSSHKTFSPPPKCTLKPQTVIGGGILGASNSSYLLFRSVCLLLL